MVKFKRSDQFILLEKGIQVSKTLILSIEGAKHSKKLIKQLSAVARTTLSYNRIFNFTENIKEFNIWPPQAKAKEPQYKFFINAITAICFALSVFQPQPFLNTLKAYYQI